MAIVVTLNLPKALEEQILASPEDISTAVRNAYLLDLFRQEKISHRELGQGLGLDRFGTDAYLKKHNVYEGSLTVEDLEQQRRASADLLVRAGHA